MTDDELIMEYLKLDDNLNENEIIKAIKEFKWAIEGSPKIRKCIEDMLEVSKSMKACKDLNSMMFNSIQLVTLMMRYHSMYADKRLGRIEKRLGIELDFGDSSI